MKILIIGGTYFLGKAFLEAALRDGNQVTLLNRGSRLIGQQVDAHAGCGEETQLKMLRADRRDEEQLKALTGQWDPEGYDCVVDFCAYEKGDIQKVMDVLPEGVKQYVFISTCDVYRRGTGKVLDETAEFEGRDFGGEAGAYILGKVALERELAECAAKRGMHYTSIRPAFIYGPDNYAPREEIFFQWISKAGQILFPEDADGWFQFVYVKDAAKCILACLLKQDFYDLGVNLCGERVTYESFAEALEKAVGMPITRIGVTVNDVTERGIPLPFPMTRQESESYDGSKMIKLGVELTPLSEGLRESYAWFLGSK